VATTTTTPGQPPGLAPGLTVSGLDKRLGGRPVLRDLGFHAPRGAVTAVVGPNGAGKTTTLRCLAGVLRPDAGEIRVPDAAGTRTRGAAAVSFLPEEPDLYPALTAGEHLRFLALAHRLDRGWRERADGLLDRFALTDLVDRLPYELSQGQRRKVAIVGGLLYGARVLLFDEPFNGLDPPSVRELRDLVVELAADGATVVVSTHGLAAAERFCDHVVVLDGGGCRAQGSLPELRSRAGLGGDADLEDVYLELTGTPLVGDAEVGP